jgi:transposase
MKAKHAMRPARVVVDKFGGCRKLARTLAISPSTVSRWMTSAANKGTDGRIPQKYWGHIIVAAQDEGFTLTVNDLAGL